MYVYACYTLAPISNVADLGIVKVLINVILSIRFRLKSFQILRVMPKFSIAIIIVSLLIPGW